ncbi:tripartite-type tricarboxylate transporter receptor subunit TctC [Cupriavidus metallidurans]|jgi:tripartite-type tricarboxylate transporter receptor subunit TctC|uniref:Tripartite tricarboxylate transporter substrate binding protein n=1 Tax=Cupriavidus metallidurans TaxID=119219 RepID=A0A482IPZ5_9BURK|nr:MULTISPECIES: tripartite tricarboxylate transporter substrate binding protein [Cupriavidus]EKZ99711.1 extra-cytoplasmic solute receptor protein [Cupriavidus sp. HMR-1]KWR83269.1 ABC transporter substrate-binding protein [Cupriavidus sp. SHE]MDE4919227.1 tripartite tricarboxylate transporter substrate binding protein [Cupriavidus metallidurans]QBP10898.1 tripartite tricarboxylate transporter substrate binding protein [Cupriavidus metallidurans]QWC87961.1 tripartite tricarboxylate transporter
MNRRQRNLTTFARVFAVAGLMAGTGVTSLYAPAAQADTWPSKPVTVIVPFPAGGGTDAFARPLTAQLSKQLGKQFVIDNRGGAGGTVGASIAAKAAPDGYTLFIGGAHHAIAPSFYKKLDYDIEKDFIPITVIAQPPQVIVVNSGKVQATSVKDLIAYAKANPGKLNYASAGNGSSHHLAGELFKLQTQTDLIHVPYKGAGPALSDLIAGQVDLMFDGLGSSSQHIRAGRIKALAVASKTRSAAFPNVPTAAEAGLPNYDVSTWYALWAPKGTPKEVVDRLYAETTKALNNPEMKQIWLQNGSDIPQYTPEQFAQFEHAEIKRWADVVQRSGAKID